MFTIVLGRYDASTVLLYPHLSEGADTVGGQLCGDSPFSGVTNCGTVWRKVPESDALSVMWPYSGVTNCGRVWRKVSESDARSVWTLRWDVQSEPRFPALFLQERAMHWPLSLQLAAI